MKTLKLSKKLIGVMLIGMVPAIGCADQFFRMNVGDSLTYVNAENSHDVVQSKIMNENNGWYKFNQFAGLGKQWLKVSNEGQIYVWNEYDQKVSLMTDFSAGVGYSSDVKFFCADKTIIYEKYGQLTTKAGTFDNVTHLKLTGGCYDAGVSDIWFAESVGVVKWTEMSFVGSRSFELMGKNKPAL
ncbi:hypothetical protein [Zooshikella ganghwensis]|uniref:Uncharacterized protein n=1 Tax=Zooshikella ganghwensis TaxID=202772 RepID=A0A4P9VHS7_9GAMM|nr:hypothetical protein [Zooshikella ganghwensis]RDH42056.1 hypothetical protein B9G39_00585 [Zooshikella ganghwensis]